MVENVEWRVFIKKCILDIHTAALNTYHYSSDCVHSALRLCVCPLKSRLLSYLCESVCVCAALVKEKPHWLAAGLCKEKEGGDEGMDRQEGDNELEEEQRKLGQKMMRKTIDLFKMKSLVFGTM